MTELSPMDRMCWVDIETTGLDPEKEVLLEVGLRLTTLDLKTVGSFSVLIWMDNYSDIIRRADEFVQNMHKKSGCFEDASREGIPIDRAEKRILQWINKHRLGKEDPLCGSSVQFDRGWLQEVMPDVEDRFSYRNIDISSVKELCRRYNPVLYSKLDEDTKPLKEHRVESDLDDTINEARFYRDNFLWTA